MKEYIQNELKSPCLVKNSNRWLVRFPEEFKIHEYQISSVTKPKYENGEWNDIRILFRNFVPNPPEKGLLKIINKYTLNKNYKLTFTIEDLDPTGVVIGKWEICVKEIVSIDFGGELSYENDEQQTTELIVKPFICDVVL